MSAIDDQGRVFGRFNLVDAAAVAFIAVLIPIGYATYLLFRPATPAIESVTRVPITNEERRIAGNHLIAKLKVKGSGFNPLLRARVGNAEALGFVFENPNSADVLVGLVPAGQHDLALYDGVQEVARARGAVEIQSTEGPWVRAVGWLMRLDDQQATQVVAGFAADPQAPNAFRVIAVGPLQPARARLGTRAIAADLPVPGRRERSAEILVRCDWPANEACAITGVAVTALTDPVTLPGGIEFLIEEVGPPAEPRRATLRVQLDGPVPQMQVGDRDQLVGARAAEVMSAGGGSNPIVTLQLGVDESRDGWRYRGRLLTPGTPFSFGTGSYAAGGRVISLSVADAVVKP
jgi:hypothetical protein